jgi:RNA-binding protein with serine-rich domain 1
VRRENIHTRCLHSKPLSQITHLNILIAFVYINPLYDSMPSRSPSRGRSRTRSHTPTSFKRAPSPAPDHSRSPRRSISPRSQSRSHSRPRSPTPVPRTSRNGLRDQDRSLSRSRSPSRGGGRSYRDRSYTRSVSRDGRGPQSSKIVVEKLTKNVTEGHLREIFGSYGQIEAIDLPLNRQCKLSTVP